MSPGGRSRPPLLASRQQALALHHQRHVARFKLQAGGGAVVGPQSCRAGTAPAVRHEGSAVVELGLIGIVAGTPQGDRALAVIPTLPERHGVMEFEPLAGRTAAPLAVAEGALPAVARPHRAPDRARNGPR